MKRIQIVRRFWGGKLFTYRDNRRWGGHRAFGIGSWWILLWKKEALQATSNPRWFTESVSRRLFSNHYDAEWATRKGDELEREGKL